MLKRREFLKTSALVATAASTGILSANAPADVQPRISPIQFVLVDEDFEDSVMFANELIAHGARAFSVREDIGRLWFGELGNVFATGNAVAGLTSHTELLVCASFARERGARIRFEGSHDCRGSEVLTHSLRIGVEDQRFSASLASAQEDWPRALALRAMNLSRCDALCTDSAVTTTRRSPSHPGSLYSWVIA
jgi:hypothetical protein